MKLFLFLLATVISLTYCAKKRFADIRFEKKTISFSILKGDTYTATFKFLNQGNDSLRILNIQASCGCTSVNYPKQPIAPGKEGAIVVIYSSLNETEKDIIKDIVVKSNTTPILQVLKLVGKLKAE